MPAHEVQEIVAHEQSYNGLNSSGDQICQSVAIDSRHQRREMLNNSTSTMKECLQNGCTLEEQQLKSESYFKVWGWAGNSVLPQHRYTLQAETNVAKGRFAKHRKSIFQICGFSMGLKKVAHAPQHCEFSLTTLFPVLTNILKHVVAQREKRDTIKSSAPIGASIIHRPRCFPCHQCL